MIDKIKKNVRRFLISLASLAIVISGATSSAQALTGVTSCDVPSDWYLTTTGNVVSNRHEGYLKVSGQPVFCVDYYAEYHSGKTVTAGTPADIGLSEAKAKRLSLIAYYGTKVAGRTSQDWYAITQGLLWREIHDKTDLQFVTCKTAPTYQDQQRCWNEILADVDRYYVMPSFASGTHEVDMDGQIELTDTNGVLSDMVVVSSGNLNVSISGNKLIIKGASNASDLTSITLKKNIAASETGTTIVYTASDCQSLGSFKIADPVRVSFRVKTNKYGNFELLKYNDDKSATIPNTSYRVTGPNGFDRTVQTSSDGKIKLDRIPVGDYKCVEVNAATGYLINTTEFEFTVKVLETTTIDPTNLEPTGKINLKKSMDVSKTDNKKGDAVINDNTYTLYAAETITNVAGTKKFYDKDQKVSAKKTNASGDITWDDLPLGNYYIKETATNDSLVLNTNTINVAITYQGQTVSKVIVDKDTSDRVNMQKIQVFKSGEGEGISGVVKGLQGAEFTFKLKSEVDHVGWDNATTYDVVTTDENGKANTKYLPYGTYLVKETATPKDYVTAPDFTISVTKDYTEYTDVEQVRRVNVNNAPFKSQVKLVKIDKVTGKTVTLNSASFKIKDSKGNYVVQKVGGVKYDTFTTNSKNNIVVIRGKDGEVTLPLTLLAGTYTIEEVETPEGFLSLENPVKFTITNQYDYDLDEDEDPMLTVKVENLQPTGTIELYKSDKVSKEPLENVEYELTATKDIISPIDGSILYKKGDLVSKDKTNKEGRITIKDLPMGSYQLKETLTLEGYVLSEEVHDIEFTQKDLTTKVYSMDIKITNIAPTGEIHLVKTDKDSNELLSGVQYQLTAAEDIYSLDGRKTLIYRSGQTVSKDISEDGFYLTNELGEINIGDLALGKYQLKETQALVGYATDKKVYDIDLSYDHSDKVLYTQSLELTNTKTNINITKVDATTEKELPGAHLTVYDKETNKVVDEWTSTNEPHVIRGLEINKTYVLWEDLAPIGYATASDVVFTVNDIGEVQKIVMKDEITKVSISKQDASTGKELPGATLIITDKDGNQIDKWISTNEVHMIYGLHVNEEYTLTEITAPEGYNKAESIKFTIGDTGVVQKVVMKDTHKPVVVHTGDSTNVKFYMFLMFAAGIAIVAGKVYFAKKKKD